MRILGVRKTTRYVRYRLRQPSSFKSGSFRTHDIGRKGHSKRIAGKLKRSGKWATQAILIAKKDYNKGARVKVKSGRALIVKK